MLEYWVLSGANLRIFFRSWKMLQSEYLLEKIGFNTAERLSLPSKVLLIFQMLRDLWSRAERSPTRSAKIQHRSSCKPLHFSRPVPHQNTEKNAVKHGWFRNCMLVNRVSHTPSDHVWSIVQLICWSPSRWTFSSKSQIPTLLRQTLWDDVGRYRVEKEVIQPNTQAKNRSEIHFTDTTESGGFC